jgi:inositol 1,4,5-triphosphate receptor type 3
MIYTLMQIFLNNKKGRDILYEDIDMREILNQFKEDMEDSGSLLQSFGKIGGLMKSGFGGLTKGLDNALKSDEEKKKDEERERKAAKKEKLIAAIEFFKKNTKQIEILRGDKISTVYFPKLPFCHKLPKDLK